jgi:hypothetical protein
LIGIDQLICQVLLGGVFTHLDVGPSDYSWVVSARLGIHAEELSKLHLVWLDPQEGFAEVDEDGEVKDSIGVQVEYSIP